MKEIKGRSKTLKGKKSNGFPQFLRRDGSRLYSHFMFCIPVFVIFIVQWSRLAGLCRLLFSRLECFCKNHGLKC